MFPSTTSPTTTAFATSVTSMAVNLPSSIASGNLLIAVVEVRNSGTWTPPSGWTEFGAKLGGGSVGELTAFYRIATGTEGSTATWTASTGTTAIWHVLKITSWHGTTPPAVATASGDSSAANPPSLSPSWVSSDTLWLAIAGHTAVSTSAWSAGPSGYSGFVCSGASSGGSAVSIASCYKQANASSENPGTFTVSGSNRYWAAMTIAIRPDISLPDNFNDNSIDGKWSVDLDGGGTVAETGGKIVITPAASTTGYESLGSVNSYDFTDSSIFVQVKQVCSGADVSTELNLYKQDWSDDIAMYVQNGELYYGTWGNGFGSVTYDANVHKWWRIREYDGNIYWEYSTDGIFWTILEHYATPFDVTNNPIGISCVENTAVASPGAAWFDNFNIVPSAALTGTVISSGTVCNNLGVNINPASVSEYIDALIARGIQYYRVSMPDYTDTTAINNCKSAIATIVSKGGKVIWGVSSNPTTITASNWSTFSSAVQSIAAWCQDNGVYEFQIGNEEEWHIDGTTITKATLQSNLKTLATACQSIFTNGDISYSTSEKNFAADWIALGKGDIDKMGWTTYIGYQGWVDDNWKSSLSDAFDEWGTNSYCSEFGLSSSSLADFSTDEVTQAQAIYGMIEYFKSLGMTRYLFYIWQDDDFGVVNWSDTYRKLWNVLQAESALVESNVVSGGKTIIITLTGDTWVASGTTFDNQRQNIIDGLDSAQSETNGWNAEVRDKIAVTDVVRTSDTVVTITLDAESAYNISAQETITVTIPSTALVGGTQLTATPKILVSPASTDYTQTDSGNAVETINVLAEILTTDNANATELLNVLNILAQTDTGAGSDSVSILAVLEAIQDIGAGAEVISILNQLLVNDTGSGADAIAILSEVALTDSGSGAELLDILNTLAVAETGQGTESIDILGAGETKSVADSGTGTDTIFELLNMFGITDLGTAVEVLSILNQFSVNDIANGSDLIDVLNMLNIPDSASATEALSILNEMAISDNATGSDVISILNSLSILDSATANDAIEILSMFNVSDTATASDILAILALIDQTDTGSASDIISILNTLNITDEAEASELLEIMAMFTLIETATAEDVLYILKELATITDDASALESIGITAEMEVADSAIGDEVLEIAQQKFIDILDNGQGLESIVKYLVRVYNRISKPYTSMTGKYSKKISPYSRKTSP
jgi:hypothetical protein